MWEKVVELTQTAFREGKLAEEATWQAMVMVPKRKGEFWGIGLVEVIWKLLSLILHRRLAAIQLHEVLHGFREGCGTGTSSLMAASCCNSLASRVAVPVPRPSLTRVEPLAVG